MLTITSPTRMDIQGFDDTFKTLAASLSYVDKRAQFDYLKFKKTDWFRRKYGEETFKERLDYLKSQVNKTVLFKDEKGYWTHPGLVNLVRDITRLPVQNLVKYPEPTPIPWHHSPKFELYPYQKESVERLLAVKHGHVEICTGGGKSQIILHLVKLLGLKTLVMAPSIQIAEQLHESFTYHLGTKYVGRFFGGKKETKKLITVGIPQSLVRLEENSAMWEEMSTIQVFICDESHLTPCDTLQKVGLGIALNAPYRFFFSATQLRQDGLEIVLDGLIGPKVKSLTVQEGVDGGYLAKPVFTVIQTYSPSNLKTDDVNELTRKHLFYNPLVLEQAGDIVNKSVSLLGHQVLVLIEEVEQFSKLLPYINYPVVFAHGPLSENKAKVPEAYWESDPGKLVKEFNDGKHPVLIGTSCVSMGTDILPVRTLIYLQGGKSEIQVRQAIGRGTRLCRPIGKTSCNIIDFDIQNIEPLHRHAKERMRYYRESYDSVSVI